MKKISNIAEAKVNKELVKSLEYALEEAKAGHLIAMACTGLWENSDERYFQSMYFAGAAGPLEMLGAIEHLKNEFWAESFCTEEDDDYA